MKTTRLILAIFLPMLSLSSVGADLTKIQRTIAKEPAFQSNAPRYCILVFGLDAKHRVWLVIDGHVLYVDRNGNGDLTDKEDRIEKEKNAPPNHTRFLTGVATGPGSRTDTPNLIVSQITLDQRTHNYAVYLEGGKHQRAGRDYHGDLRFADRPQDAPIIHFDGPLQMSLVCIDVQSRKVLTRGKEACELYATTGTPGVGNGTFVSHSWQGFRRTPHLWLTLNSKTKRLALGRFESASRWPNSAVRINSMARCTSRSEPRQAVRK